MAVASGTGGIDAQLATYFADFADRMPELRKQFAEDGYIEIPDFAPAEVKERLLVEVDEMLEKHSRRRHLEVKSTGNSPRYYEAVGRNTIVENAEVIPYVYQSPLLKDFLAQLTGETEIVPVPWEPEEIVITRMTQAGDSHGWHWDDY